MVKIFLLGGWFGKIQQTSETQLFASREALD
jgi:hypothetical protein